MNIGADENCMSGVMVMSSYQQSDVTVYSFVSVGSDFVLATPSLVPRLDTSVDATLLLCEGMSYFS